MNWSIIIFCYNEEGNLEKTVRRCADFLRDAAEYEILIINDGSTDGTNSICEKLANTVPHLTVINHAVNQGIGPALKTGYKNAQHEYICAIPGDGQFDAFELSAVKPFAADVFYSFHREKNNYNLYRKILTRLNRMYNRFALGIFLKDVNWIKVYRKEQLAFANIQLNSSILESEICAKLIKCGAQPIEIPSLYNPRETGIPKGGSWKTLKMVINEMYQLYQVVRQFNRKPIRSFSEHAAGNEPKSTLAVEAKTQGL